MVYMCLGKAMYKNVYNTTIKNNPEATQQLSIWKTDWDTVVDRLIRTNIHATGVQKKRENEGETVYI